MSWGEVVFDDGVRSLTTEVDGSPVLLPDATRFVRRSPSCVRVEPVGALGDDGMPDVLVGRLPVVTWDGRRLRAEYIDLPPPLPFRKGDVSLMWETLRSSPVPLPSGIGAQGRLDLADPAAWREKGLEPEFLPAAHRAARALAAEWPPIESIQHTWRPIDVTAGREDERSTEKRAGLFPAIELQDGTRRPTMSSRIVPSVELWRSNQLAAMAREVLDRIIAANKGCAPEFKTSELVAPFEVVARQAQGRASTPERPFSTWPPRASAALTAFGALLSDVAPSDAGITYAPLCHLWRLFESWVALQVYVQLADDRRLSLLDPPEQGRGDEWHAVFDRPEGQVIVVAQPQISDEPASCKILERAVLFSVSSILQPDVVVAIEDRHSQTWHIDVYDAKKHSRTMTPGGVAEAASKYVWGIRRKGLTGHDLAVRAVTLITTREEEARMFSTASRIDTLCAMPSDFGVAGLGCLLRKRLV